MQCVVSRLIRLSFLQSELMKQKCYLTRRLALTLEDSTIGVETGEAPVVGVGLHRAALCFCTIQASKYGVETEQKQQQPSHSLKKGVLMLAC